MKNKNVIPYKGHVAHHGIAYANQATVTYTAPTIKAQDPTHYVVPPLLRQILEIKRPTNNPGLCAVIMELLLRKLGITYSVDKARNFTVEINHESETEITESRVCFTSHTDTVHNDVGFNELIVDNGLLKVKGGGVLGADCGTGIYIMLEMILAKVPGLYVFFAEEEKGRIGSKAYTMPEGIDICISFDRKATTSLITEQSGQVGCSKEFAAAFIEKFPLPYVDDPTGSYTDSFTFFDDVPECVNLSVGYYSQHTQQECQDLGFLAKLVEACKTMDWESLPAVEPAEADNLDLLGSTIYQGTLYHDIEDFCYDYYPIAAEMLEQYGITLADMIDYAETSYGKHEIYARTDDPFDFYKH